MATTANTIGAPNVHHTGLGYEMVRDRTGDGYSTVYIHQLVACLDHDPHDVFSDSYIVERELPIPWLNTPENLDLVPRWRQHQAAAD